MGTNEYGKLPPQAIELEDSVLGAIMIEKDAYETVAELLRPSIFYKDQNRIIYEAIRELATKDEPIDILSVSEKLKNKGTLEQAGGSVYLSELTRRVASTAHLYYHAQILAQKATARDLIAIAAPREEKAFDETQDIKELMTEAEASIFEISQRSQKRDVTQIDLPFDKPSGLKEAMRVLEGVEDIKICRLTASDVVRHVLVQRIIEAYDKHSKPEENKPRMSVPHKYRKKQ